MKKYKRMVDVPMEEALKIKPHHRMPNFSSKEDMVHPIPIKVSKFWYCECGALCFLEEKS